jgi:histidinol-phosphate aminotransferase
MATSLPQVPAEIRELVPYQPGKPIEELERELGIKNAIKLASNENPLGPSPLAVQAMQKALAGLHRYPDGAGFELRQALGGHFSLPLEQICLGNGSDEIIEFICRAFIRPGQEAVAAAPSFLMYSKLVQVAGGRLREVPLKDFRIDLKAILGALTPQTRVVFINNPDNPAGTAVSKSEFGDFLDQVPAGVLVVLDEAYIDFATDPECAQGVDFLGHQTPVLVMRTFSKIAGLAGLRIGFGLGPAELIAVFDRVRQPFNTSIPAQVGAMAALEDTEFREKTLKLVQQGLSTFYECFDKLNLFYVPSQTNFVLVKVGPQAGEIADRLLRQGIIVRYMGSYDMPEYLRISVGLDHENQHFVKAFHSIISDL